ncbi:MAG: nitrile hydratase [Armatimonadetes bacterium]|nr:nitrile hydratase [Armatimonadota bacterium]
MDRTSDGFQDAWRRVVARAWSDPGFRAELLTHPDEVLERAGIHCPDGARFVVVENSADRVHLVLPAVPSEEAELAEADASAVGAYHAACW